MTPLVIIPARQFSQGTPGKNRVTVHVPKGYDVLVATDDPMLASGTAYPVYRRPLGDDGPVGELVARILASALFTQGVIVVAAPSSATEHRAKYIKAAVHELTHNPEATSVVSVVPWVGEPPQKACTRTPDGYLSIPDAPSRRQDCSPAYRRDGTVYAVRAEYARQGDLYGPRPVPLLVTPSDSVTVD